MTTARDFSANILRRWTSLPEPPSLPERADPASQDLPPRERPLAFDLLTGILRWRNALDAILASRLRQPLDSLDPPIRAVLWIGAFQLLFQSGTADYAAVDAAVTLARRLNPKASGLVNAVLRGITRLLPVTGPLDTSKPLNQQLSRRALALDFQTQLFFNTNLFPDPSADLTAHLAAVRSHPPQLVAHFRKLFGDPLTSELLLRNNQRPAILLRVDQDSFTAPAAAGLAPHSTPRFLIAAQGWNASIESLVHAGQLSPQDPTAAMPIQFLAAEIAAGKLPSPTRILDLCAGLGTKTIQLARAFPSAQIFAADIDERKLHRLQARADQIHQKNIQIIPPETPAALAAAGPFDLILIDAPCSNTGVLARRVQSRWRWPTLDLPALTTLQRNLLTQAREISPTATLLYSTCSIDPIENQLIMEQSLATNSLYHEQATLPSTNPASPPHDGGYFTLLRPSQT